MAQSRYVHIDMMVYLQVTHLPVSFLTSYLVLYFFPVLDCFCYCSVVCDLVSTAVADNPKEEVQGIVGSTVKLNCVYGEGSNFDLSDFYVYWQLEEKTVASQKVVKEVASYVPGKSSPDNENNHYRHRAHLSLESMEQGDFSLYLHNITPQDEQTFHCRVIRKSLHLNNVLHVEVTLHVAANYSMPVVSSPTRPTEDEVVTFTCRSTNGYPVPKVYWINQTDNSLLDEALQNSTVYKNEQNLYDVVSTLSIRWTPNLNVQCCIENALLHQNLTVSSSQIGEAPETSSEYIDRITDYPNNPSPETHTAMFIIFGILAVTVAMAAGWFCTQGDPPELRLTDLTTPCVLTPDFLGI
ncbi:PREDICTED: ICOS ligand [Elephantulus edwardii]|uniref:ICOS ligand n=1 Tax=Elephantulus edwardii TaxID=28737 RepID=UPI0003F0A94B|nr:PREDICTED: ICOS ligand [Elephantulus edwardii]